MDPGVGGGVSGIGALRGLWRIGGCPSWGGELGGLKIDQSRYGRVGKAQLGGWGEELLFPSTGAMLE